MDTMVCVKPNRLPQNTKSMNYFKLVLISNFIIRFCDQKLMLNDVDWCDDNLDKHIGSGEKWIIENHAWFLPNNDMQYIGMLIW